MSRKISTALLSVGPTINMRMQAPAKWELEIINIILFRRKKLLPVALLLVLLTVTLGLAFAGDIPSKIPILGGSKAFVPAFANLRMD